VSRLIPSKHAKTHKRGGSDPLPGGLTACWSGQLPTAAGTATTQRVPEIAGASGTWTITKVYFRCETAGAGTTIVVLEKMTPDADGAWSTAATVASLSLTAGHYETSATVSGSVTTGDLLRIRFTALGTTGLFTVEATGV
jgi:hypothetical protein